MSLNIITLRDNFIVLASDRRACVIDRKESKGIKTELVLHFDGDRKSYFLDPPHNFVGFSINGWEIIEINELMQEFKDSLPNNRLTIKQYADELSEFFGRKYAAKAKNHISNSESLKFNVVGFDEDNQKHYYRFELPDKVIPEENFNDVIDGAAELLGSKKDFLNTLKTKLENKKFNNLTSIEKRLLNRLRDRKDPFNASMKSHSVENSKYLIEFVSKEQAKRDEIQSVGGGADVLVINPETGVEVISYGEKKHIMCDSDVVQHYVSIECCETSKIQIDFNSATKKGYKPFPEDDIFECEKCSSSVDLSAVKERFLNKR